ncbi:MAG: crosslink repair DNA glycosylase YcaQ family protein [Rhodothermales bacterium]
MNLPTVTPEQVIRLWLRQQGLLNVDAPRRLTQRALSDHLESTGGLQLDSINVLDRAHYLTLWSRFGAYDRRSVDRWIYEKKLGYEYWGHEATILPISHLPIGRRRMIRFPPPSFKNASWWTHYDVSTDVKRRVLRQLRSRGPLESAEFDDGARAANGGTKRSASGTEWSVPREENRALKMLWHAGKVAVVGRRHFRQVFDLAERHYPDVNAATTRTYFDSWLLAGLRGNGVCPATHLRNYYTSPKLTATEQADVIRRCITNGSVREVRVAGSRAVHYALPEHLDEIASLDEASGTTLLSPFDSFLWQRRRAQDLLDFQYRVEIYVPKQKRVYGYYAMPILHNGRLVGRIDPKLHRESSRLEIASVHLEQGFRRTRAFDNGFREAVERLAEFVGASQIDLPPGWNGRHRG